MSLSICNPTCLADRSLFKNKIHLATACFEFLLRCSQKVSSLICLTCLENTASTGTGGTLTSGLLGLAVTTSAFHWLGNESFWSGNDASLKIWDMKSLSQGRTKLDQLTFRTNALVAIASDASFEQVLPWFLSGITSNSVEDCASLSMGFSLLKMAANSSSRFLLCNSRSKDGLRFLSRLSAWLPTSLEGLALSLHLDLKPFKACSPSSSSMALLIPPSAANFKRRMINWNVTMSIVYLQGKENSYWKPPFLRAMLVLGSVYHATCQPCHPANPAPELSLNSSIISLPFFWCLWNHNDVIPRHWLLMQMTFGGTGLNCGWRSWHFNIYIYICQHIFHRDNRGYTHYIKGIWDWSLRVPPRVPPFALWMLCSKRRSFSNMYYMYIYIYIGFRWWRVSGAQT